MVQPDRQSLKPENPEGGLEKGCRKQGCSGSRQNQYQTLSIESIVLLDGTGKGVARRYVSAVCGQTGTHPQGWEENPTFGNTNRQRPYCSDSFERVTASGPVEGVKMRSEK
jgi:hypothetical protein